MTSLSPLVSSRARVERSRTVLVLVTTTLATRWRLHLDLAASLRGCDSTIPRRLRTQASVPRIVRRACNFRLPSTHASVNSRKSVSRHSSLYRKPLIIANRQKRPNCKTPKRKRPNVKGWRAEKFFSFGTVKKCDFAVIFQL